MTYHLVCNTMDATIQAEHVYPSGAAELTIGSMCSSFSFQCSILHLIVCHFVLFCILKLFLHCMLYERYYCK